MSDVCNHRPRTHVLLYVNKLGNSIDMTSAFMLIIRFQSHGNFSSSLSGIPYIVLGSTGNISLFIGASGGGQFFGSIRIGSSRYRTAEHLRGKNDLRHLIFQY